MTDGMINDEEKKDAEKKRFRRWETIICTSLIVVGLILSLVNVYIPNTPNQKVIEDSLKAIQKNLNENHPLGFPKKGLIAILGQYKFQKDKQLDSLLEEIEKIYKDFPEKEFKPILSTYLDCATEAQDLLLRDIEKLFLTGQMEQVLKKLDQLNDHIMNTEMTNIFFRHIVGLLAILSGMIGFFWISISKKREEREESEKKEREDIREWELSRIAIQNSQHQPIFDKIINSKILKNEGGGKK